MRFSLKKHTRYGNAEFQGYYILWINLIKTFQKVLLSDVLCRNALFRFLHKGHFCIISGVLKMRKSLQCNGLEPYAESLCRLYRKHPFLHKLLHKRNAVSRCGITGSDLMQIMQTNRPLKGVNPRLHNAGFYPFGICGRKFRTEEDEMWQF